MCLARLRKSSCLAGLFYHSFPLSTLNWYYPFANQSLITFYIFESQVKKNAEIKRFLLPLLKLFVFLPDLCYSFKKTGDSLWINL